MSLEELRREASKKDLGMRSCWNCNHAHEGLKQADYPFLCFVCGRYFYKGIDITEDKK